MLAVIPKPTGVISQYLFYVTLYIEFNVAYRIRSPCFHAYKDLYKLVYSLIRKLNKNNLKRKENCFDQNYNILHILLIKKQFAST